MNLNVSPVFVKNANSVADVVVNEGGTRCFKGSQKVVTNNGAKKIKDLKAGDLVLSHDFDQNKDVFKKVSGTKKAVNSKKTIKIKLKSGETITATEDHKFYFKGGWHTLKHIVSLLDENNKRI